MAEPVAPHVGLGVLLCRDGRDRLQDAAGDGVGIALGVRTAIFEVALVTGRHEAVWDADGSPAVGDAPVEFVDRLVSWRPVRRR